MWWEPYILLKYGLKIEVFEFIKSVLKQYSVITIGLILSYYVQNYFEVRNFFSLIIFVCTLGIVSLIIFVISYFNNKDLVYFTNLLKAKLKQR